MEILLWRQVYDSRFEGQQRRKHDVQNRFLPWALGGETDWRKAANDWVDGEMVRYSISQLRL